MVIPMGYCCPTAEFLKMTGVRRLATPLDWCKSTLSMWQHVLSDGGNALMDESLVRHNAANKPYHATYCGAELGGAYTRTQLWLHGHDRPTWARRCERLRELLHDATPPNEEGEPSRDDVRTPTLAVHVDFENISVEPAAASTTGRLDECATEAAALSEAAQALAGAKLHIVAILFVTIGTPSALQADVTAGVTAGDGLVRIPLEPAAGGDGSFAIARLRSNVTLLRYVVPHGIRNGAGNPLPKGQNALLEEDATRLHAVVQAVFPDFFC